MSSSQERIFHLSSRTVSAKRYKSVPGRFAYSTGVEITDEKTGKKYHKKAKAEREGIETEMVLNPDASEKFQDTNYYFNKINNEKRMDGRVFYEFDVALFNDLSKEQNKELMREYGQEFANKYNVPVSLSFHKMDSHNPHCHMIFNEREVKGEELSKKKSQAMRQRGFIKEARAMWSEKANEYFKKHEKDLFIDHRSHKERGLEKEPMRRENPKSKVINQEMVKLENRLIRSENKEIENVQKYKDVRNEKFIDHIKMKERIETSIRDKSKELQSPEMPSGVAEKQPMTSEQLKEKPLEKQAQMTQKDLKQEQDVAATQGVQPPSELENSNGQKPQIVTLHRLYSNEIKKHENKFLESRRNYKEQKEKNVKYRNEYLERRDLYKKQINKSRRIIYAKKMDIARYHSRHIELKSELKKNNWFKAIFSSRVRKERKRIKDEMVQNYVKLRSEEVTLRTEQRKHYKLQGKLREHQASYKKEKRKEFDYHRDQVKSKVKAKTMNKEKAQTKNKVVWKENSKTKPPQSLGHFKKTNKVPKSLGKALEIRLK